MKKRSPVAADNQHGAFRLIEFTLPKSLCRKIDAAAQERVESKLRTITSLQILMASIKLKVPTHRATQIIKENRRSVLCHLEAAYRIMEGESFFSSFPMIGYASTPEDRDAWMRFPDDMGRVIEMYHRALTAGRHIFPTKGWANAKVAFDVAGVLAEEGIRPALSIMGIWANVTKYVLELATGKSVSSESVKNAMRQARSLSVARERVECKTHEKQG